MSDEAKSSQGGEPSKPRNVSGERRIKLGKEIDDIREFLSQRAGKDRNAKELLKFIADLKKELQAKKYGLVFEEHREKIDDYLENNVSVLTEEKELFINGGGELNFLIEGDNLASLRLLERTHRGKIDLIYIDPPYNTGKEFIYNDNIVEVTDTFRHSKWLSFMSRRLEIARRLLSETGMIFISIDDNESAQLKLLCDELFGENNFVANIVWQSTVGSHTGENTIITITENILAYSKSPKRIINKEKFENDGKMTYQDEYYDRRGYYALDKLDSKRQSSHYTDSLNYPIECPDGTVQYPGGKDYKQGGWNYLWSKDKVKWGRENGFIHFKKDKAGGWKIYNKRYEKVDNCDNPTVRGTIFKNLLTSDFATTVTGSRELAGIFGSASPFDYPKPTKLVKKFCELCGTKRTDDPEDRVITILDFFAGSGTTGHAVMQLNKEDGGKRRFILCTNNENSTGNEEDGICRKITYPRLKKVIDDEDYKASLKYFRVDFVPISEKVYQEYADKLLDHIRELVELENAINFTGNAKIAIILTEKELDDFTDSLGEETECEVIYLGHNTLVKAEQQELFNRRNIKINKIPDYYFEDLANS